MSLLPKTYDMSERMADRESISHLPVVHNEVQVSLTVTELENMWWAFGASDSDATASVLTFLC